MIDHEVDTKYVKKSQKVTPTKTNHKHEYISFVTYNHVQRTNGSVSEEKYRFATRPECKTCGNTRRRGKIKDVTEIEVTPREYKKLQNV